MIMINRRKAEIFHLDDFRNCVVDNLSKAQIKTQNRCKLYSILQPTRFFRGKSFIRIIAQIKLINQNRFLLCLFIWVFKFPAWLFDFSPVCVFMCVLKWPAWDDWHVYFRVLGDTVRNVTGPREMQSPYRLYIYATNCGKLALCLDNIQLCSGS